MPIARPLLLPRKKSLKKPTRERSVYAIAGKDYLKRKFQEQMPNLLQVQDEKEQTQTTIFPGECGLTDVINDVIKILH